MIAISEEKKNFRFHRVDKVEIPRSQSFEIENPENLNFAANQRPKLSQIEQNLARNLSQT